jgi:hypothetical protein
MQAIDTQGILGPILIDPARKIPDAHLASVCKIHQGKDTCRYIARRTCGDKGFVCVKHSKMQPALDKHAAEGKMVAQSDNCEGLKA